ncbi:uncharacterized protein LOC131302085 [Rhododendron vialii]|uniref:uncharacterized protein LOC131302085 n=1 Tax=Rhododendron vialii TaxID=182163 RepID=UPI00265D7BC6|nr:uncharacterized protein LOC131302085 [Rhododendron vialii]
MIFRPMASILRLLVVPSTDESALYGETRQQNTSEMYMKQLEVVRLLRALFRMKVHLFSFDFEKDINANPRELLFLLLSSYGATLSEVDLEIYSLMLEIESANLSNSGSIAERDYLWGRAAIRIRKEREQEQDLSSHMMKDVEAVEGRRTQFRENLPIDPKLYAYTVLHFPYGRNVVEVQHGDSDDMNEINYPNVEQIQTHDPVFILRFSIHRLLMGYIEPVEFTSLGLLAIAFVSISSPHDEMRKLGYEALGGFKNALESIPLFANFLWSNSVNFRTDRLWILCLLYAGLDSDDDAQIYIRNNILEILLGFYASPLSDIESKEMILQVVKKSVKVHKLACHLVEHCSIISWLSSIVSVFCGKQYQTQTNLPFPLLNRALEVVNDVISTRNIIEWLQQFALEQLSELSTHLYELLVGGNLIEKVHLVTSVLEILTSTLKISLERKVYQPHFTRVRFRYTKLLMYAVMEIIVLVQN